MYRSYVGEESEVNGVLLGLAGLKKAELIKC